MALSCSVGALSFPLADTGDTTLADFDAGRDIMLALMAAALNYELADRWGSAVAGTPQGELAITPVKTTHPGEPSPELMRQAGLEFPLLCCYRAGEGTVEQTGLDQSVVKQNLIVEYIVAPWSAGTERKLQDVFRGAVAIGHAVAAAKGHTAYALDPTHPAQALLVLGPGTDCANFLSIALTGFTYGKAQFSQDPAVYHSCRLTFSVTESFEDTSGVNDAPYLGEDLTHDLIGEGVGVVEDFSGAYTEHDPPT
jgi:hypothetical protein